MPSVDVVCSLELTGKCIASVVMVLGCLPHKRSQESFSHRTHGSRAAINPQPHIFSACYVQKWKKIGNMLRDLGRGPHSIKDCNWVLPRTHAKQNRIVWPEITKLKKKMGLGYSHNWGDNYFFTLHWQCATSLGVRILEVSKTLFKYCIESLSRSVSSFYW